MGFDTIEINLVHVLNGIISGALLYMNTNARGRPLARFLAKIVIN